VTSITRRRPGIPADYGIASGEAGMLHWDEVAAALSAAPIFWVSTVTLGGGPHLIPIWGAFTADAAFIEGGAATRWSRNLAGGDGRAHLGIDHAGMQVMVRGTAEQVRVAAELQRAIGDAYRAKYPYRPGGNEFWRVAPEQVLAWKTDTIEAFASTPTQFDFGGAA
jgi:hypothetical protein